MKEPAGSDGIEDRRDFLKNSKFKKKSFALKNTLKYHVQFTG